MDEQQVGGEELAELMVLGADRRASLGEARSQPVVTPEQAERMRPLAGAAPRWHLYLTPSNWSWTGAVVANPEWVRKAVVSALEAGDTSTGDYRHPEQVAVVDAFPKGGDEVAPATAKVAERIQNPEGRYPRWALYRLQGREWSFLGYLMEELHNNWALHPAVRALGMADAASKRRGVFSMQFSTPVQIGVKDLHDNSFTIWTVSPDGKMESEIRRSAAASARRPGDSDDD